MENIKVKINNKYINVPKTMTLQELSKEFSKYYKFPIILAKVDGHIQELSHKLKNDTEIEFLDLTSREGNRSHVNGLIFLLLTAVKELYGTKYDLRVEHSLDKGIYIESNFVLNEARVRQIKEKMEEIIEENRPISKLNVDRLEALEYFDLIGDKSKVGVIKYNTGTYINLYKLGKSYNYFYSKMPTSTAVLKDFDMDLISKNGMILRFPTIYINDKIKEYTPRPNMFKVFSECRNWGKLMHIENSAELNEQVSKGTIDELIRISETKQNNELLSIAEKIKDNQNIKLVLIAGPSSSGKTTTSKKLCMYMKSFGLDPSVISMDDYFVEKNETPIGEDGKPDYECLEAVDLKLFDSQVAKLLNHEKVKIPSYNFILGTKEYKNNLQIKDNGILVIEGIHALDDRILTNIKEENKYKIYISALTELNIDNHNRISTTDNRLLRRIIRDSRTRGYSVEATLASWDSVRKGEEKHIFPYQCVGDYTFNTALIYEIGVLKTYVEPLLYSVETTSPYYEEAIRLLDFLKLFLPIPADAIPQDSILREFIGGSCFSD
ncbi:MAG: nucleoside kinase [Bacilli bacterium]|nr:nucleoside kinase [Bacilli bacterium]